MERVAVEKSLPRLAGLITMQQKTIKENGSPAIQKESKIQIGNHLRLSPLGVLIGENILSFSNDERESVLCFTSLMYLTMTTKFFDIEAVAKKVPEVLSYIAQKQGIELESLLAEMHRHFQSVREVKPKHDDFHESQLISEDMMCTLFTAIPEVPELYWSGEV